MDEPSLWASLALVLASAISAVYAWRAKRSETRVASEAGLVAGYGAFVDDLRAEIGRLRDDVAKLRQENDRLYDEVCQLRRQLHGIAPGGAS